MSFRRPDDTGWIQISPLLNGWVNFDGSRIAQVRRLNGIVYLRGVIAGGAVGTRAFVLAAGFRPGGGTAPRSHNYAVLSNSAFGSVGIEAAGDAYVDIGSSGYVYLDGIVFPAAA